MTMQELLDNLGAHSHPIEAVHDLQHYMEDKNKAAALKRIGRAIAGVDQAYVALAVAIKETLDVEVNWLSKFDGSTNKKVAEGVKAELLKAETESSSGSTTP